MSHKESVLVKIDCRPEDSHYGSNLVAICICVLCTHELIESWGFQFVCLNLRSLQSIVSSFVDSLFCACGEGHNRNYINDVVVICLFCGKSLQCVSCTLFHTNLINYVKVVLHEAKSPTCRLPGSICRVQDPLKSTMVGSNRQLGTFQVRPQEQDFPNVCQALSLSNVYLPFSIVQYFDQYSVASSTLSSCLCNNTHSIWRSHASVQMVYHLSFLGKASISGEIFFL